MPLHPAARALMDQLAAGGEIRLEEMTPAQAREAFSGMALLDGDPVEVPQGGEAIAEAGRALRAALAR